MSDEVFSYKLQVTSLLQRSVSLVYIHFIKLYILSSVVICNYAIETSRGMPTPEQ